MNEIIWVEKYRPVKLDDVVGQDNIIKKIKEFVKQKRLQHLLFTGKQGTGKTATALCIAKELFGVNWKDNFLELNSSDERGIDVVRGKIKSYANTQSVGNSYFKIILLDECDALTKDAQNALRRTIEKYSTSCKFILSCNYLSKLIEPLQSRTVICRFKSINNNDMKKRLLYISEKENLIINDEALEALIYVAEGDLRSAINNLEISSLIDKNINIENVFKSSGFAHPEYIRKLIETSLKGNFNNAVNLLDVFLIEEGLQGIDILKQMYKEIMIMNLEEEMKIDLIDRIGEIDFRISEGADERIQMKVLITQMIKIGK